MKIKTLTVHNVRGIKDLDLEPHEENLVVWGPNGSGKSGVIDAVDFLLTGRMNRLTGEGTSGISLKKHGPHVDVEVADAYVKATVAQGDGSTVEMTRSLSEPDTLVLSPESESVRKNVRSLRIGQHVLTRREILRFVTANAGTRAEQMRSLLNLTAIETGRKSLVNVRSRTEKGLHAATGAYDQAVARFAPLVGSPNPQPQDVLKVVNDARRRLGAGPVDELQLDLVKKGATPPRGSRVEGAPTLKTLQELSQTLSRMADPQERQSVTTAIEKLANLAAAFDSDPELLKEYRRRELLRLGIGLLPWDGHCPLCETEWDDEALTRRLESRLAKSDSAHAQVTVFEEVRALLTERLRIIQLMCDQMGRYAASGFGMNMEADGWDTWLRKLESALEALAQPAERMRESLENAQIPALLTEGLLQRKIEEQLQMLRPDVAKLTPTQQAWDSLTRVEEVLGLILQAERSLESERRAAQTAAELHSAYCRAQEQVLQELYGRIEVRFGGLYRFLHESDENTFEARLTPKDTGLDFEVDFYGRGPNPPQALHSEGHQDSMGICLFLTLYERLASGISFVLLDDVVMSVDAEHRRSFARLLMSEFPDRQFIITTHDRTWAHQLRAEGLVKTKNLVRFHGWAIETGPSLLVGSNVWNQVEKAIKAEDVPQAAAALRKALEEHSQQACELLRAPVRFSTTGQWELSDLAPPAMSQLRKWLKQARRAATSWDQPDVADRLAEIDSTLIQISARLDLETWGLNENVHYNAWTNYSREDFLPVVDAVKDFFSCFECASCGTLFRVVLQGPKPSAVKCACGTVNWNLGARE